MHYRKAAPARTPESYVPSDEDLIAIVEKQPGLSLHQLAGLVWPDLPWSAGTLGADSATGKVREWAIIGNRTTKATAAEWLRDRLEDLVQRGQVHHAPRKRDEVDVLAGLAYVVPDAVHL